MCLLTVRVLMISMVTLKIVAVLVENKVILFWSKSHMHSSFYITPRLLNGLQEPPQTRGYCIILLVLNSNCHIFHIFE